MVCTAFVSHLLLFVDSIVSSYTTRYRLTADCHGVLINHLICTVYPACNKTSTLFHLQDTSDKEEVGENLLHGFLFCG